MTSEIKSKGDFGNRIIFLSGIITVIGEINRRASEIDLPAKLSREINQQN